jgi:hypothetical protein
MMATFVEIKKYVSGHRIGSTLFIANVTGAIVYLFAAMPSWAKPEELAQGVHPGSGDAIVWVFRTWPIFICFGLLNAIWLLCSGVRKLRDSYLLLATAMIWLIAMWIDFAHH